MNTFTWLLKREYWEHRGGFYGAPFWVSTVMLALTLLGIILTEVVASRARVSTGIPWQQIASNLSSGDYAHAGAGLDVAYVAIAGLLCIVLFFVVFFYLLGALYDDRRDRSVLFWKSLPVTDSATVLSKVAAAVLLAPLISFLIATAAYVVLLIMVCTWALVHGVNPFPAIAASHSLGLFWRLLLTIPIDALYALPTAGWLLFWSARARSKPFLWAVLVPLFAWIGNAWIGKMGLPHFDNTFLFREVIARILFGVFPGRWLRDGDEEMSIGRHVFSNESVASLFDPANTYAALASPGLWIGVLAGVVLIVLAIHLRRTRIETAS